MQLNIIAKEILKLDRFFVMKFVFSDKQFADVIAKQYEEKV